MTSSVSRMAKSVVEKHIKMLKEFDDNKSEISTKSEKTKSDYHSFLKIEVEKINQELLNTKEVKTKMEIRRIAIERWKLHKK